MEKIRPAMQSYFEHCKTNLEQCEDKLKALNEGQQYFENKNRTQEDLHSLYFAALNNVFKEPKNILEIGVGYGRHTRLLSKLYPQAMIYAVDIPETDPSYSSLAIRQNHEWCLESFRDAIKIPNVKYIEKNSFFLFGMDIPKKFDIIYVDADHHYPACVWDIMYAYNYCEKGGYVFIDDFGGDTDVKPVVDYIEEIIPESIQLLPWAGFNLNKFVAWFIKR